MALTEQEEFELLSLEKEKSLTKNTSRSKAIVSNAIKETVAGLPDMVINAPSHAMNLGRAAQGMLEHTIGDPKYAPEITSAPSPVSKYFAEKGWTSPQAEPQTRGERLLSAGTGGATAGALAGLPGAVIGGISGLVGQAATEYSGHPIVGILANLLTGKAGNVASRYGTNKVSLANELKKQKAPLTKTTNDVRDVGYVMPPSMTNPTMTNRAIESLGGKAALAQDSSSRNQAVTDALVRKSIDAPPSMGITEESLGRLAESKAGPYRDMSSLAGVPPPVTGTKLPMGAEEWNQPVPMFGKTPQTPDQLVHEWRSTNLRAKQYWNEFSKSGKVEAFDSYTTLKEKAAKLERDMEAAAQNANRPEMVKALREAKTEIAKIHDVERALNTDRGEVSAIDLARAKDKGVPFSGDLLTAAKMGNAFPKAVQRPENIGSPGVSNLNTMIGGIGGGGIGGTMGALAGGLHGAGIGAGLGSAAGMIGVPYAQMLVRQLMLSKPYQKFMGTPNYDANMIGKTASKIPMTSPDDALLRAYILSQQQGL